MMALHGNLFPRLMLVELRIWTEVLFNILFLHLLVLGGKNTEKLPCMLSVV